MDIKNIKNTKAYQWGNGAFGWHLLQDENLSVIEELVPALEKEQRHYHNASQQLFYVLSGSACIELDGEHYELNKGDSLHVKAKTPHQLMNKTDIELRFLVISQPKSHGDRVNL